MLAFHMYINEIDESYLRNIISKNSKQHCINWEFYIENSMKIVDKIKKNNHYMEELKKFAESNSNLNCYGVQDLLEPKTIDVVIRDIIVNQKTKHP